MVYVLVKAPEEELSRQVNDYVKAGFIPLGGPCSDGKSLYQAMIRKTSVDKAEKYTGT